MNTKATKVALVTGGSNDLSAAIAKSLASEGDISIVISFDSDPSQANNIVQQLAQISEVARRSVVPHFVAIQADMGKRDEIDRLVTETVRLMGRLDIVISNVVWAQMTGFLDLQQVDDEADWDRCFNVNVKSHFSLFQASRNHLEKSGGAFIVTASEPGTIASRSSLPYAVTNAALIHLSRSLATIAAPNIRVNSVAHGALLTDQGREYDDERLKAAQERNSLKRFATPEDVALTVKYFALAKSITGQNSITDAGCSL